MSDKKIRSVMDSARQGRQVVEPYQPIWMAHWMQPHGNAEAERCKDGTCGNEELNCVSRGGGFSNVLDASRHFKELKAVEAKTFQSVKSSENELGCQETDNEEALRQEFGQNLECGKAVDWKTGIQSSSGVPAVNGTFVGCNSSGEGISKNTLNWAKTHSPATDRSFAALSPFKETVMGSSAHIQPCYDLEKPKFGKGKAIASPSMMKPSSVSDDQLVNAKSRMLNQENCCKNTSLLRDLNKSLLFDIPSTSDHYLPMVSQDSFPEMQKCSGMPLLPSQLIASEEIKSKKSHYNFHSLQKLPNCVQDMETMRVCTTVDSVEATPGGFPRFSKTTHSLLITKKADANQSKEVFRTTRLYTEANGNISDDIPGLWPFSSQRNRGVKLQPLSSSSNSEEKLNVEDAKAAKVTIKNESSADTDTMDMDCFKEENSNPGANCTPSTKVDAAASGEIRHHWKSTGLPDINPDFPALLAVASSSENARASSSRTQSLEMDMLLAHAEQPKRKSNPCLGDSSERDPIMRWVKRLKLTSPNSPSQGTRSPTLAENSSADKMSKFPRTLLNSGIVSSEPIPSKLPTEAAVPLDNNGYRPKDNEELPTDILKKDKQLLRSHAWIKRWLQNESKVAEKNPKTVTVYEPTSSKLTPDNIQNKQFPSIAAMALMGKSLNGLQSCDLYKQGSFTVWNSEGNLKML